MWGESWRVVLSCVLALSDPMDCGLPGSSVQGTLQARIWQRVVTSPARVLWPFQWENKAYLSMPKNTESGKDFYFFLLDLSVVLLSIDNIYRRFCDVSQALNRGIYGLTVGIFSQREAWWISAISIKILQVFKIEKWINVKLYLV